MTRTPTWRGETLLGRIDAKLRRIDDEGGVASTINIGAATQERLAWEMSRSAPHEHTGFGTLVANRRKGALSTCYGVLLFHSQGASRDLLSVSYADCDGQERSL